MRHQVGVMFHCFAKSTSTRYRTIFNQSFQAVVVLENVPLCRRCVYRGQGKSHGGQNPRGITPQIFAKKDTCRPDRYTCVYSQKRLCF